ncbi:MAG: toll/interleukin-1 receptor domain-containing protein, partial [Pseudomonadota bacterium]
GLNPRGLSDLDMVDLTFAAAREHRYHDVLNAIRGMEDQRRSALRAAEDMRPQDAQAADTSRPMFSMRGEDDVIEKSASRIPGSSEDASSELSEEAPSSASAPSQTQSRGFPTLLLLGLLIIAVAAGGVYSFNTYMRGDISPEEAAERVAIMQNLETARGEVADLKTEIELEEDAILELRRLQAGNGGDVDTSAREENLSQLRRRLADANVAEVQAARRAGVPSLQDDGNRQLGETPHSVSDLPAVWLGALAAGTLVLLLLIWALRRGGSRKRAKATAPIPDPAPIARRMVTPRAAPKPLEAADSHDAFVSYSHQNAETVLPIVESIEESGISVWIDRDELRGGQNWAGQIVRAIKSADRFCLMCSAQAFESDHVRREVYLADKYGKTMVPIRLDESEMPEDIEYFLIGRQWVDVFEMDESDRSQAIKAILSNLEN